MIEFSRTISEAEVKSTYLNLTDDDGQTYGSHFPAHKTKLTIVDQEGRVVQGQMHRKNQLWGGIEKWFVNNQVAAGDIIIVRYDPDEEHSGRPVVHLELQRTATATSNQIINELAHKNLYQPKSAGISGDHAMAEETPRGNGFPSDTIEDLSVSEPTPPVANEVPDIVIGRLPIYLRALDDMAEEDVKITSSQELSARLGVSSVQIRKDLSHFGVFGKQGTGYDITYLQDQLKRILHVERTWPVALVGCGDLGQALANYDGLVGDGFEIVALFDNDPDKTWGQVHGKDVMDIAELPRVIREKNIKVAIIAVPGSTAQAVADALTDSGVKAILNYSRAHISAPPDVRVQQIDPGIHLQRMTYYLDEPQEPAVTHNDQLVVEQASEERDTDIQVVGDDAPSAVEDAHEKPESPSHGQRDEGREAAPDSEVVITGPEPKTVYPSGTATAAVDRPEQDQKPISDEAAASAIDESPAEAKTEPVLREARSWYHPVTDDELAEGDRYLNAVLPGVLPKESLATLDDWERYLVPQVRQVEILGEISITQEDGRALGQLFGQLFEKEGLAGSEKLINTRYRGSFAVFLVIQGIYGYKEGDYWSSVSQATGQKLDANWKLRLGQLFESIIRTLGLNTFLDYPPKALRYLSRILGHGGIPQYCLDDFFENLLRPAVTRDIYSDMSAEELIDEWLLRSSSRYLVDKPVLRFIEFGGQVALDFVERCRELAREYLETGLAPGPEEVGLPGRVVEHFHEWAVERDGLGQAQADRPETGGLRLHKPEILLDPWGEGVTLLLPPQQIPATLSQEQLTWQVKAGAHRRDIPAPVRRVGYDLRSREEVLPLDAPCQTIEVSLWIGGQCRRTWNFHVLDEDRPLLVFDALRGNLLRRRPSLPARHLWLLYPRDAQLNVSGVDDPAEDFHLPWGWSGYCCQAWDLGRATGLSLDQDGQRLEIPIRPDEGAMRPHLVGGDLYTISARAAAEVPLYVGTPPRVRVPLVGRTAPDEELGRWRLTLRSQWAAQPKCDLSLALSELHSHLEHGDGWAELPLNAAPLLGAAPYGNFVARVRGPLGRDAELRLRVVPDLSVTGHETLYLPDAQAGPQPVALLVETRPGTHLELQVEDAGDRLDEVTQDANRWLHPIQAGPETTLLEVNVVKTLPGGDEAARVPLRIPIHRLRWAIQDAGSATPLSDLLNGQVILHPVDALLQADSPMLFVELPGVDARTLRLTLRLLDVDGLELQAQDITSSRNEQVRWRFELGRFADTIRLSDSPILRLALGIDGLPDVSEGVQVPLMRLTQSLMVEDMTITPTIQDETVHLKINWISAHPLRNRFIRFWPLWQPWADPIFQPIPDEARGEFVIQIDPNQPQLQPSKYRLELGIADPWSPPAPTQRPGLGEQNTLDVAFVAAEHRLRIIDQKGRTQGGSFALALEHAIIQRELGHQSAADKTLQWCYEHLDAATLPQTLALVDYLHEIDDEDQLNITQLKLFAPARVETLLSAHRQGKINQDQFRRYLANMPRARLLPVKTARLLLDVQDAGVELPALQRLIQHREPAVIDHVLARCKGGAMSDDDAVAMMSLQADFAIAELERRADDPVAMRLLGRLSDAHLVRVGDWVHCMAGWGRIKHIVRLSDEQAVERFLRKERGFRLLVTLRPQRDAETVTLELFEDRCKVQFERAHKLYRCTKVEGCCFITRDPGLLTHDHNRASHGGIGPQFAVERKSVFQSVQPPVYSTRAPRNILT